MSSVGQSDDAMRHAVSGESRTSDARIFTSSEAEAEKLLRIANLAEQLNNAQIADDARSAAERIAEGRFYVACVGQFKRGKSTLLNALIGKPLLPAGVVPVTSVPTILRFGERYAARVRLRNGAWTEIAVTEVEDYGSEARNPENRRGVTALEVFVPSPLLAEGMCLVDTPGLGSVFAGNTASTHGFLPHIDAAIVVVGADPPIAGDELALVERVARGVPDILFVLNKADRVTEAERDEAISFARQVLESRLQPPLPPIFEISALEQLDRGGSQREWSRFVDALKQLVEGSGHQLVREAANRSLRHMSGRLLAVAQEERDALTRPFAESEKRISHLKEIVSQAEQSLNDLGYLFSGEQQRLLGAFAEHRDIFLKSARQVTHRELSSNLESLRRASGPKYRRSAMQAAQDVARRHTMPWLETERKNGEEAYRKIAKRFTDLTAGFLAKIRGIGVSETYLPSEFSVEQDFRTRSEFRFYDYIHLANPASPVRYVADFVLGAIRAHSVIDTNAHGFLDLLLETNSERVRNDLAHRITESRRQLEAEIRTKLRELNMVAENALARARTAYAAGAAAVESSLQRLAGIEAELARLGEVEVSDLEPL